MPTQRQHARDQLEATMREGLREAMSRLAGGVTVITTWVEGRPWGTTVSSCCSLSMQPPLLLVCLANRSLSTRSILGQESFGVNILHSAQADVARSAAAAGRPKFLDDLVVPDAEAASPALRGALAWIHCELYNAVVVGDHTIVIGEVSDVALGASLDPLIYFDREFRTLTEPSLDGSA
jgi:flavin reductase ActVB